MMIVAWFGLENLLLWSIFFKNFRFGVILHIFFASLTLALFLLAAMIMITHEGFEEIY